MLNHVSIMGRLVRDPELRKVGTEEVSICSFTIANDRDYGTGEERETDFIDIVAWRKDAEFVCNHFKQGDSIIVNGRLQARRWTDGEGTKRRNIEVVAENIYFAGGRKKDEE